VDAGRAYRNAGKVDEARKAYATVLADYGDTPSKTEATVRLAELTKGQMATAGAQPGS
jgi:TolA-binding protein